jgi:hypothetical protein
MGAENKELADFYDVDDTLFYRNPVVRFGSAIRGRILQRHNPVADIIIPDFDHQKTPQKLSGLREWIAYMCHMGRRPNFKVIDLLKYGVNNEGADPYVNTGRSSGIDWFDGTRKRLADARILYLFENENHLLFSPGGKHTALSKIHAIKLVAPNYAGARMTDDDWWTVHLGATVMPDVAWRYVYHGFPCIYPSKKDFLDHPSISVLDLTRKGNLDAVP